MAGRQDFRSEKMESREGRGLAQERRRRWEDGIPADVMRAAYGGVNDWEGTARLIGEEEAEKLRKAYQDDQRERSALLGFWLSWHLAGGFAGLEGQGWNRATLFRKVKRFRVMFDAHPDEYSPEWVNLDLSKAWYAELDELL